MNKINVYEAKNLYDKFNCQIAANEILENVYNLIKESAKRHKKYCIVTIDGYDNDTTDLLFDYVALDLSANGYTVELTDNENKMFVYWV